MSAWGEVKELIRRLCLFVDILSALQLQQGWKSIRGNPLWLDLCPCCLNVSLLQTLSPLPAYSLLIQSSNTSCMALPNQGLSNWVVKGGRRSAFYHQIMPRNQCTLSNSCLFIDRQGNMSGNGEAGGQWCDISKGLSFRVFPPRSKQTLTRRVPLVKTPLSLSPLCAAVRDFVADYWT